MLVTESIGEDDAATDFDCGSSELNSFFARHAFKNDRRGIGKTFVLRRGADQSHLPPIIGFYTLSMAGLAASGLPRRLRDDLPKYPLPVALIGRLAVDKRSKGQGFGNVLMGDAFVRVLAASETVGCFGVVVDAKDKGAEGFYERFGFLALGEAGKYPRRMFLELPAIRAADEAGAG
jgi:GNAT superfamily N-acetyltransferase